MTSLGDLAESLGVDEADVAFLADAPAKDRDALVTAVRAAGAARDEELRQAVDRSLGFIPRPLRGRVMKLLRAR